MLVGFMAGVPFMVSKAFVRTFDDYNRNSAGRWAKHELLGQKPVLEFIGPDTEKISFSMHLRTDQGIAPEMELNKLRKLRDKGKTFSLVIGGRPITQNLWVLESIGETVMHWGRAGSIIAIKVDVTLQEYVGGKKL